MDGSTSSISNKKDIAQLIEALKAQYPNLNITRLIKAADDRTNFLQGKLSAVSQGTLQNTLDQIYKEINQHLLKLLTDEVKKRLEESNPIDPILDYKVRNVAVIIALSYRNNLLQKFSELFTDKGEVNTEKLEERLNQILTLSEKQEIKGKSIIYKGIGYQKREVAESNLPKKLKILYDSITITIGLDAERIASAMTTTSSTTTTLTLADKLYDFLPKRYKGGSRTVLIIQLGQHVATELMKLGVKDDYDVTEKYLDQKLNELYDILESQVKEKINQESWTSDRTGIGNKIILLLEASMKSRVSKPVATSGRADLSSLSSPPEGLPPGTPIAESVADGSSGINSGESEYDQVVKFLNSRLLKKDDVFKQFSSPTTNRVENAKKIEFILKYNPQFSTEELRGILKCMECKNKSGELLTLNPNLLNKLILRIIHQQIYSELSSSYNISSKINSELDFRPGLLKDREGGILKDSEVVKELRENLTRYLENDDLLVDSPDGLQEKANILRKGIKRFLLDKFASVLKQKSSEAFNQSQDWSDHDECLRDLYLKVYSDAQNEFNEKFNELIEGLDKKLNSNNLINLIFLLGANYKIRDKHQNPLIEESRQALVAAIDGLGMLREPERIDLTSLNGAPDILQGRKSSVSSLPPPPPKGWQSRRKSQPSVADVPQPQKSSTLSGTDTGSNSAVNSSPDEMQSEQTQPSIFASPTFPEQPDAPESLVVVVGSPSPSINVDISSPGIRTLSPSDSGDGANVPPSTSTFSAVTLSPSPQKTNRPRSSSLSSVKYAQPSASQGRRRSLGSDQQQGRPVVLPAVLKEGAVGSEVPSAVLENPVMSDNKPQQPQGKSQPALPQLQQQGGPEASSGVGNSFSSRNARVGGLVDDEPPPTPPQQQNAPASLSPSGMRVVAVGLGNKIPSPPPPPPESSASATKEDSSVVSVQEEGVPGYFGVVGNVGDDSSNLRINQDTSDSRQGRKSRRGNSSQKSKVGDVSGEKSPLSPSQATSSSFVSKATTKRNAKKSLGDEEIKKFKLNCLFLRIITASDSLVDNKVKVGAKMNEYLGKMLGNSGGSEEDERRAKLEVLKENINMLVDPLMEKYGNNLNDLVDNIEGFSLNKDFAKANRIVGYHTLVNYLDRQSRRKDKQRISTGISLE